MGLLSAMGMGGLGGAMSGMGRVGGGGAVPLAQIASRIAPQLFQQQQPMGLAAMSGGFGQMGGGFTNAGGSLGGGFTSPGMGQWQQPYQGGGSFGFGGDQMQMPNNGYQPSTMPLPSGPFAFGQQGQNTDGRSLMQPGSLQALLGSPTHQLF